MHACMFMPGLIQLLQAMKKQTNASIFSEKGGMSEPFHSAVSPQGGKDNRHKVVCNCLQKNLGSVYYSFRFRFSFSQMAFRNTKATGHLQTMI